MSINSRIRDFRNSRKLTQQDFADKIGIKRVTVSWLEKEGNTVTEQNIKSICQAYGVSEQWLRDGVGEMMSCDKKDNLLDQLAEQYHFDSFERSLASAYLHFDEKKRHQILAMVRDIVHRAEQGEDFGTFPPSKEDEAARLHARLDAELQAEKKDASASSSSSSESTGQSSEKRA